MNRHQLAKRKTASMQWMWVNWMTLERVYQWALKERKLIDTVEDSFNENGFVDPIESEENFLDRPSSAKGYTIWEKYELLTTMYQAGTTDITRSRKFIDEKIINSRVEREEVDLEEMVEWEDLRWSRNDIPDIVTFWEQGGDQRESEWMDGDYHYPLEFDAKELKKQGRKLLSSGRRPVGIINDRDFRERCTKVGNTIQAVYIRNCEDDLRIIHDPEWIAEQLECDMTDAITFAESFRRLGIDRNTAYKLINGYWDGKEWKPGLNKIGVARGAHYAKVLEQLCIETDAITDAEEIQLKRQFYLSVSQEMVDSGDWCLQYGTHNPYWNDQMQYIEEMVTIVDSPDSLIVVDKVNDDLEGFISPFGDEEVEIPQVVTATWRLFNGSETLDHDTICQIKNANVEDIGIIIRKMFPQGRFRAEWGYHENYSKSGWMTLAQTRQAWWYINDRREKLATMCSQYLTAHSRKVLGEIRTMNKKQARAYLATYCAGNAFNMYGREITWKHRPCAKERYAVWAEFRKTKRSEKGLTQRARR